MVPGRASDMNVRKSSVAAVRSSALEEDVMRIARIVFLGLVCVLGSLAGVAGEGIAVKDDFAKDNPKWKFVTGQWVRRTSGGRPVLAQTVETQPWAVALLQDMQLSDVDVSVRFRPISGKEDASGGIILRARDGRTTCSCAPTRSRTTSASTRWSTAHAAPSPPRA